MFVVKVALSRSIDHSQVPGAATREDNSGNTFSVAPQGRGLE